MDNVHDLFTFMGQITHEIESEYQRIYSRASEDPGTAGDEGEENWATLLREWLPPAYRVVTKGRLINHKGEMSPQIDVLVLKPFYPTKLLEKKVWLADGVAAVFECKTTLTAAHVKASVKRAVEFKKLFTNRTGNPASELRSHLHFGVLAHSHSWKNEKSLPLKNIIKAYEEEATEVDHPSLLLDTICVADLAIWTSSIMPHYEAQWDPNAAAYLRSVFQGDWGVMNSMNCASHLTEGQRNTFTPVGALIGYTIQRLARHDATLRDLADYYRRVNLWGSSNGRMRPWTQRTLTQSVRDGVNQGLLKNGDCWDDWTMYLT